MINKQLIVAVLTVATLILGLNSPLAMAEPTAAELISGANQQVPIPGIVNMVDLGAHQCIPCKMMAPILKELSVEYDGKAAIVFIDVWENPEVKEQFGIKSIPTQIFYDSEGNEVYRHTGFLAKKHIVKKLKKFGVE